MCIMRLCLCQRGLGLLLPSATVNDAAVSAGVQISLENLLSFPVATHPEVKVPDQRLVLFLIF